MTIKCHLQIMTIDNNLQIQIHFEYFLTIHLF